MAKDKQDAAAARMSAVMIAAGRSPRVAEHLPPKYQKELAALSGEDGKIEENVRDKVISILRKAGEENKANIDEDEGDGGPGFKTDLRRSIKAVEEMRKNKNKVDDASKDK